MPNLFERDICKVLDISIDIGSISSISQKILKYITSKENRGGYVCVANVHMLTVAHEDSKFRSVLENANLTIPDGIPLVWTQRLKGHKNAQRVCGPDLMLALCHLASEKNQSIYLLGATPTTLALLTKKLVGSFPGLKIAGAYAPEILPTEPDLDLGLVERINTSEASLLFVGLGCPKQEFWCAKYAPHLKPLSIGVGAAFDFHAGTKKRPPPWIQKMGFEWLFRLISEPKRLWKRYLSSNTTFLYLSLKEFLGSRS